ncbi:hypothetical protein LJC55_00225 [Eubacteriales bacterium OttesenSCG-928-N14]|nr:hypothetical protein [Eubacteriales bacterium OttesenSCG-928-N14]
METVDRIAVADDAPQLPEVQDGFYKSQEEVDRAFALRLAAERKKWEAGMQTPSEEDAQQETGEVEQDAAAEQTQTMDYAQEREFLRNVMRGEEAIKEVNPGFDMGEELAQNPLFALMVAQGLPIKRVYDFFYPQQSEGMLRKSVEQQILSRMRMRNARPKSIASANAPTSYRDISKMSDDEILNIDARIKRGERVVL